MVTGMSCIVHVNLMMGRKNSIKSILKEVIMIRMHEISNKERVIVENIEDIASVNLGRGMNIIDLILPCVVCLFFCFFL